MNYDVDKLVQIANSPGGVVVLVIAVLLAGARGWWVYGRTYNAAIKERDEWKVIAEDAVKAAERLTGILEDRSERPSPRGRRLEGNV